MLHTTRRSANDYTLSNILSKLYIAQHLNVVANDLMTNVITLRTSTATSKRVGGDPLDVAFKNIFINENIWILPKFLLNFNPSNIFIDQFTLE